MDDLGASDPGELGRYRARAVLGEGGMGRVLLATGPHGDLVAIKRVHEHLAGDQEFRKRFRREVAASRKVTSDHTAAVVGADPDADVPWLASRFVYGPSLREALAEVDSLPEESVLRLARGLAAALQDIHRVGLVHRDLSSSNVLLADDGPKVIDFGIVRAVEGGSTTRRHTMTTTLTTAGMVVGAPGFMSPEQAEGRELTSASDVFSLGTTLLLAFTGRNPFEGPGIPQTMYNVVHTTPDLGALPDRLRRVIETALRKAPGDRPTPAELLERVGPLPETALPWPAEVHRRTERQRAEVRRRVPESDAPTVTAPPTPPPTLRVPPSGPGPTGPPPPARSPRDVWRVLGPVLGVAAVLTVLILAGLLGDDGGGRGGTTAAESTASQDRTPDEDPAPAEDFPDTEDPTTDEPEPDPEPEPHPIRDAEEGDCFTNSGTMEDMDLEATTCGDSTFEAVEVLHDTTDSDDCGPSDWTVSYSRYDLVMCLDYQHSLGDAYHASEGDCVYGDSGADTDWTEEGCETGNFTVLERLKGTKDTSRCEGGYGTYSRYFTVERWPELNAVLCLRMNYPDDIGYAEQDTCMIKTGSPPDLDFEFADCDRSNVVVIGRTPTYDDPGFCGDDGWSTWRPRGYPGLAYTACFRGL